MITLHSWLQHLRELDPPQSVVVVGAGTGSWMHWCDEHSVPDAHFIEADEESSQRLRALLAGREGRQVHNALIGSAADEVTYYQASNPAESSLLQPESLAAIWPQLRTRRAVPHRALTLAQWLSERPVRRPSWLIVDCLPALPLLQGAGADLEAFEVILARAIAEESLSPDRSAAQAQLAPWLVGQGYREAIAQSERHPALVHTLYVRDWPAALQRAKVDCNAQARLAKERQAEVKRLTQALEEQTRQATEREQQIKPLTQTRDEQTRLAKERQADLERLTQARDEQTRLAKERQAEVEQITQERAKQVKLAKDRQAEVERLTQALEEQTRQATEREQQIKPLTQTRDEQTRLAKERQAEVERLTQTLEEQTRQATEREQQIKHLTQARDEQARLAKERQAEVERLVRERDQLAKQIQERQAEIDSQKKTVNVLRERISQLEGQCREWEQRQTLMTEEMHKAEGQIELIKDLLLRE